MKSLDITHSNRHSISRRFIKKKKTKQLLKTEQLLRNYSYLLIKERCKLENVSASTKEYGTIEFYNNELKRIEQTMKGGE